jgi:hypothetical protein
MPGQSSFRQVAEKGFFEHPRAYGLTPPFGNAAAWSLFPGAR